MSARLLISPFIANGQELWKVFWQTNDKIFWTGTQGLTFGRFSSLFTFLAGIVLITISLEFCNYLARVWRVFAEKIFSRDTNSQRILEALERAGKSVLEDNTSTALTTILREGIQASSATGAQVGEHIVNLAPNELTQPNNHLLRLSLEQNLEMVALFKKIPPNARETNLWRSLGTHASTALRLQHLLNNERADASEQERQRIARELHDSVAQALYGIALGTRSALEQLESNPVNAKQALEYAIDLADGGTSEMKTLLFSLRPDALEEGGLASALQKLGEMLKARYKLEAVVHASLEPNVTLEVKGALYRIAQEAVHNTVKHAKAKLVSINLEKNSLEIADNGQGFDLNATRAGALGLKSMRERAESIDANFEVTSSVAGTRILVVFGGLK